MVLALRSCARVNVYEYVPSMRLTKRCHYYDTQENLGCTIGDWHPLAAEKLVTLKLNSANDTTVFSDGYVSIKVCSTHKGRTGAQIPPLPQFSEQWTQVCFQQTHNQFCLSCS